jgi:hypothetical protein
MVNYPSWAAGDPITASGLNATQGDWIIKPSNTTRTSTIVLADDPDLTTTLEANAVYHVDFRLRVACVNAEDFMTDWTVPSGASGNRDCLGAAETVTTDTDGKSNLTVHRTAGFATDVVYGGVRNSSSNQMPVHESAIIATTSAGTLALRWAQGTSGGTGTTLAADSSLHVKRIS